MEKPLIGILAGMGPKSTGPFVNSVVARFQAMTGAVDDSDFPPMMIYSLPTPFYVNQPIDHENMKQTLSAGLKKLEECGAAFIAMPCNTVHQYFDELQKAISVPLLNMIDITIRAIPASVKNVAILGTRVTLESGLFQRYLDQAGVSYVIDEPIQLLVDKMLREIKGLSRHHELLAIWNELSQKLIVDTILLACTDFSPFFSAIECPFAMIDSSDCLAKAIVETWLNAIHSSNL